MKTTQIHFKAIKLCLFPTLFIYLVLSFYLWNFTYFFEVFTDPIQGKAIRLSTIILEVVTYVIAYIYHYNHQIKNLTNE